MLAFTGALATTPTGSAGAAAAEIVVPPGCGTYSNQPLPAGWSLDDHSGDAVPIGDIVAPCPTRRRRRERWTTLII
jgi:hypothetical protein